MNVQSYIKNNLLRVKVVPHSSKAELTEDSQGLKLYLQAPPEKDKANKALIRFFKREYNLKVQIKSGAKSRDKVLLLLR